MPVSFTPGPHPSSARRTSASSPYPSRVMTSIPSADYPSPTKARQATSSLATSPKKGRRGSGNPFCDADDEQSPTSPDTSKFCQCENITCSPEEERFPLYSDSGEAERNPLLGDGQRATRRRATSLNAAAVTLLAMVVATVLVVSVVRAQGKESAGGG